MQTSVLLVDDDRRQASRLHDVIQGERPDWTVYVPPHGSDPIRFMTEHSIDVVVQGGTSSSSRDCCEQIKAHFPYCVHLSADDMASASESLVGRIEESCGVVSHLHDRELQNLTKRIADPKSLTDQATTQLTEKPITGFNLDHYFQHAQSVGRFAETIASVLGDPTSIESTELAQQALIAGTLHDIGKLVLAVHQPQEFGDALALAETTAKPLWQAEMAVFGTTHAAIGAHLLCSWGYPMSLIDAVALHHQPSLCSTPDCPTLVAVHVANAVQHANQRWAQEKHLVEPSETASGPPMWDDDFLDGLGLLDRARRWAVQTRNAQI